MAIRVGKSAAASVTFTTPQEIIISQSDDTIQIYGNDGALNRAIKTDTSGFLRSKITDGTDNVEITDVAGAKALSVAVIQSVSGAAEALRLDTVGDTTYVGTADTGVDNASNEWKIKRIVDTSGDLEITWADGDSNADNVWDDRVGLSYS